MNKSILAIALTLSAGSALGQATAFRGTHVGFTTLSGTAGEQLDLRTGYGTSGAPESEQWAFRFETVAPGVRQLQTRSARHAVDPNAPFTIAQYNLWHDAPTTSIPAEGGGASPVAGWYAQSSMAALHDVTERQTFNPTGGDAFLATGNIDGGSYAYEILDVNPLGGSPDASFALGLVVNPSGNTDNSLRQLKTSESGFDAFGIFDHNQSAGGSIGDRSIFLGTGNHFHGWGFFVSEKGVYEISLRVYDVNGRYEASDVFTFQVNSIPTPASAALMGLAGLAAVRRRR